MPEAGPDWPGLAGLRLAGAAYAVANHVIGSALMEVGAQRDDGPATMGPRRLRPRRSISPATATGIRISPRTAI